LALCVGLGGGWRECIDSGYYQIVEDNRCKVGKNQKFQPFLVEDFKGRQSNSNPIFSCLLLK